MIIKYSLLIQTDGTCRPWIMLLHVDDIAVAYDYATCDITSAQSATIDGLARCGCHQLTWCEC